MSAIAGIFNYDGMPVTAEAIGSMTRAMVRRGPDGMSQWVGDSVALGQCMFHTTPESLEETQPWPNEDGSLVLVMDGRVDNVDDLRTKLLARGARLRNRCDAELVLRAYEAWQEDCPQHIIGEFVFMIWDSRRRQLFGARDALGSRHFYYHAGNSWFGFASEIKGLLALERIEKKLNETRVLDYLAPAYATYEQAETCFRDIVKLPAGHAMRVSQRGIHVWRYWDPGELPARDFASLDDCAEAFLDQFRVAVKCRLRSIAPVGAALSGGLDSSSIVGLIRKELQGELAQPLRTFSLVLDDREACPEWPCVRAMLREGGIEPTVISSDEAPAYCEAFLDHLLEDADEPFALSTFMTSIAHEAARKKGCQVYLDGGAGDLLFYSGSATAATIFHRRLYSKIPPLLAGLGGGGAMGRPRLLAWLAKAWLAHVLPAGARRLYRSMRSESELYGEAVALLRERAARQAIETMRARDEREGFRYGANDQRNHARRFMNGQLAYAYERGGELGLSRRMEPRSPFSDRRLIEFAVSMPVEAKFFGPWYKNFLRERTAKILPEEVRWRIGAEGHPGWKFWNAAVGPLLTAFDVSQPRGLTNLSPWVDLQMMETSWPHVDSGGQRGNVMWLLKLAVLDRWIGQRKLCL